MILGALLGKGVPNVSIVKRADYAMGYYPVINIKVRHDAVGFLEALERALLQQDIESTIKTEVRHKKSLPILVITKKRNISRLVEYLERHSTEKMYNDKWKRFLDVWDIISVGDHASSNGMDEILNIMEKI